MRPRLGVNNGRVEGRGRGRGKDWHCGSSTQHAPRKPRGRWGPTELHNGCEGVRKRARAKAGRETVERLPSRETLVATNPAGSRGADQSVGFGALASPRSVDSAR